MNIKDKVNFQREREYQKTPKTNKEKVNSWEKREIQEIPTGVSKLPGNR